MSRLAIGFLCVGAALLALGGLQVMKGNSDTLPDAAEHDSSTDGQEGKSREEFAQDRASPPADKIPFDGARAISYLEEICKIGPRISGTEGFKQEQDLAEKHFKACGGAVNYQRFTARQRSQQRPVEMANMIISWFPDRKRRVILCSHYDTRPIADQEPDRRNWHKPFISANDGGSGVALLMELANHMKTLKTTVGVDFVLFDGEEYIFEPTEDKYFFGSEYFGKEYRQHKDAARYIGAILLDMVGGKGAVFPVEQNSWFKAEALNRELLTIAMALDIPAFQNKFSRVEVLDDHIALNAAGIPTVDIIDFDYAHWHRLTDVPSNCSAESLTEVARVLTAWLQRQK